MPNHKFIGGARIGILNQNIPFASLQIFSEKVILEAGGIGRLEFKKDDIIKIEEYIFIPIFAQGIQIKHKLDYYDEKVIFWSFRKPKNIIKKLKINGIIY